MEVSLFLYCLEKMFMVTILIIALNTEIHIQAHMTHLITPLLAHITHVLAWMLTNVSLTVHLTHLVEIVILRRIHIYYRNMKMCR